ncbi:YopX family protein [Streptococcus sp. AM43-2AT]|uniref:YopX family protein n=1 Tax=Streptococcus sp. AM43-2AT TaxID=2293247 RepID=UPI000ECAC687|nr:YopX family protein [Streptococcus sp. AM43-2AT]RJU23431.1 hypothetical protein DW930_09105 [Streptococcus sp. AM43-2AT]
MIPKFRAWLKQYNVMVDDVSDLTFFEGNLKFIGRRTVGGVSFQYSVEEIELMQSTGVLDKDGQEIFEGDIVKMAKDVYSDLTYYEIIRHRGGAYRLESNQHGCELWLRHTNCEVIGNIYENTGLLEVE